MTKANDNNDRVWIVKLVDFSQTICEDKANLLQESLQAPEQRPQGTSKSLSTYSSFSNAGKGVRVYLIDTGLDYLNSEFDNFSASGMDFAEDVRSMIGHNKPACD